MKEILKNIYRFDEQYFYGSPVGVYLISLETEVILFEIPTYTVRNVNFVRSFNKPVKAYLSHGSTGIQDGSLWQRQFGVKVYMHHADDNYAWLRMNPGYLFEEESTTSEYRIIHTPGHSPGSISLLHFDSKSLLVGDTLGAQNGQIMNFKISNHDDDLKEKVKSIQKLAKLDFDNLLPFHYEILIGEAAERLRLHLLI